MLKGESRRKGEAEDMCIRGRGNCLIKVPDEVAGNRTQNTGGKISQ